MARPERCQQARPTGCRPRAGRLPAPCPPDPPDATRLDLPRLPLPRLDQVVSPHDLAASILEALPHFPDAAKRDAITFLPEILTEDEHEARNHRHPPALLRRPFAGRRSWLRVLPGQDRPFVRRPAAALSFINPPTLPPSPPPTHPPAHPRLPPPRSKRWTLWRTSLPGTTLWPPP